MYRHAPKNYICPICLGINGIENTDTLIRKSDIVFKDTLITAFISSFFIGKTSGHVIIVPNIHAENLYDLPAKYGHRIMDASKNIALAIKTAYNAEGITLLQNNEPAGNQHALHYHLHVFPRFSGDDLHKHMLEKRLAPASERRDYAEKIKAILAKRG